MSINEVVRSWFQRYFSDEEAVVFFILFLLFFAVVLTMGSMLVPVFAGIIVAFLLEGLNDWLRRRGVPHIFAVSMVFTLFLTVLMALILVVIPLVWKQVTALINDLPRLVTQAEAKLSALSGQYPTLLSEQQIRSFMASASGEVGELGQAVITASLSSIPGAVAVLVYLILVPILVFFFMKDKDQILAWLAGLLPRKRSLMRRVWIDMDQQIANYVRGKAVEITVVGAVTFVSFTVMGLKYATLLGVLVGLSVVVPYIGAAVVTIPVAVVGFLQWGLGPDFVWLMVVYGIIQALDGNVLVPLLFSEVVNLHPVAIIVAVLVFGGLWGFWGVFFAIPLATLVKAMLDAWPQAKDAGEPEAPVPAA